MSAADTLFIAAFIFAIGIALFLTHYTMTSTYDIMVESPEINSSANAITTLGGVPTVTARFDYIILAMLIGLSLAMIITGFLVGGVPIFMFFYFIIVGLAVVISTIFANVWESVTNTSALVATLASFPMANHILLNLPYYISIIGFIGIVVMFAKPYIMGEG